ncbi:ATP-binding protein [Nonomuraea sp. NPDC048901]|uniref:ATP-binding protein n=1 Tax=Nonomuraea sp. NPDC048901 TaxID=3155627 RepID=UPI0033E0D149
MHGSVAVGECRPETRYGFDFGTLVLLRRLVERYAARHGLTGPDLYRFVVAVNEITTNAVRHGGERGRLSLWQARQWVNRLTIESDANGTTVTLEATPPQPDHP